MTSDVTHAGLPVFRHCVPMARDGGAQSRTGRGDLNQLIDMAVDISCWRLLQGVSIFSGAMVSVTRMATLAATRAALRGLDFYLVPSF